MKSTQISTVKSSSPTSLLLSTAFILVGSVVTGTLAMVLTASISEVSQQMQSSTIDTFLDLVATIFFTVLNVIAAGAESVQTGFMVGLYAGVALSALYLVYKWLTISKGWHVAASRK